MRVPRCGTHNGIKYNNKRYLVRWCIICNMPFHPNGSRDKVCSDTCRDRKTYNHNVKNNFKNNPTTNSNKAYQPPQDEAERRRRNNYWKTWYANTTAEYKAKYNMRKNKKNKNDEPQVSSDAELDAMYAELGMTRRR